MVLVVLVLNQEAKSTPFRSSSFAGMTSKFYYKVEFVRSSGVSEEVKERVKESLSRSLVGAWIEGNKKWPWHGGDLGMLVEKQFDKKWSSPRFNSREMAKTCCLAHVQDGGYLTGTFYVDVEFGLRDKKFMKLRVSRVILNPSLGQPDTLKRMSASAVASSLGLVFRGDFYMYSKKPVEDVLTVVPEKVKGLVREQIWAITK